MVMSLSPVDDTINSVSNLVDNNVNDNLRVNTSNTDRSPNNNTFDEGNTTTNGRAIALIQSSQVNGSKRKSSRRANTAERRATHNAVERQRRETLNGRFLDLAALLPNLSQIRRPPKSSIVNSSIAHIQASRRHRLYASRELRMLKHESDALRRELNEWRDRESLPRLEEPVRSEGFGMVLTGELEVISGISIEEEDEDADDGFGLPGSVSVPTHQHPHHVPPPQHVVGPYDSSGTYMDDAKEGVGMFGPNYGQQGVMHPYPLPHTSQMQHQQHQQQHHALMAHHHDLDDPHVAAMLLKNSNPFAHNIPNSSGYPAVRSNGGYANGPSSGSGWGSTSQPVGYAPSHGHHTHLFTPPATSHGVSNSGTASDSSTSSSPVGGLSSNGNRNVGLGSGSPISPSSSLSGGSPLSIITHPIPMGGGRRRRSGCLTGNASPIGGGGSACGSGGGQNPAYELHAAFMAAMHEFGGVPRMGGHVGLGMSGGYTPTHHQQQYGHAHGQQVGGGVNGGMMMCEPYQSTILSHLHTQGVIPLF